MKFNYTDWKIVLWGWKGCENTYHYIHEGYYKAFKHLGAKVFWYDDNTDISNIDFKNTLFFTEGQQDQKIPIREDCLYVLHNCYDEKYKPLLEKNYAVYMQTYTDDVLKYNITKLDEAIYADYNGKCLYFFWPTNLLPHEIEANKPNKVFNKESKFVHFIGTVGSEKFGNIDQITPFKLACERHGITFTQRMGVSTEENIRLIKESYMAPTIVGKWQHEVGYIPCRLMKNISYGQFPITNSPRIASLLENKTIYQDNTNHLFYDAKDRLEKIPLSELHSMMDYVAEKHTFISRINTILSFIDKILNG